jgi:hypothetical protein
VHFSVGSVERGRGRRTGGDTALSWKQFSATSPFAASVQPTLIGSPGETWYAAGGCVVACAGLAGAVTVTVRVAPQPAFIA